MQLLPELIIISLPKTAAALNSLNLYIAEKVTGESRNTSGWTYELFHWGKHLKLLILAQNFAKF